MKTQKLIISFLILIPLFLQSNTITVKPDGTGNYTTIQEAINIASIGDTVLVYPGNYIEIVDFIGKDIVVASLFLTTQDTSYISQTIIDGNNENYKLVRFTNGETHNAILTGFTITNAYLGYYKKPNRWTSVGLGIYINGSSPVIDNNRIINNSYNFIDYCPGGGVIIENSSAKITNNIIRDNDYAYHGGGIYINNSNSVIIENNIIDNNTVFSGYGVSFGAGIYIDSSQYVKINNNSICGNKNNCYGYGGGLYISASDNITILNNNISNNRHDCIEGGGIYAISSNDISIIGNLLYNNNAENYGGGICCYNSEIVITNNTICFNTAFADGGNYSIGGGIYCTNSSPVINNTIFFSNTATLSGDQVYLDENSDPDFYYSNIEGGVSAFGLNDTVIYTGIYENNIETDPQFLLSGDYPYSLEVTSPCINAGNPDTTGLNIPEVDLAGELRIANNIIDIGAYERLLTSNLPQINISNEIFIFPNPAKDMITINIPEIQSQNTTISIMDINGNPVLKFQVTNSLAVYDISSLNSGLYIIKIIDGELVKTEKIVVY